MSDRERKVSEYPKCDYCDEPARYDARTKSGAWANMCQKHFEIHGIGLGAGRGQKLVLIEKATATGTFEAWMCRVNQILERSLGLNSLDLPDQPYYDWFDGGTTPAEAAREVKADMFA